MTTPAVDISEPFYEKEKAEYYSWDGQLLATYYRADNIRQFARRKRPKSINSPKQADGWREPTNWYHYGRSMRCPLSTVEVLVPLGYEDRKDRFLYIDGYLWVGEYPPYLNREEDLVSKAEMKALLKLKDQRINLGQAFAERAQTAKLFGSVFTRISKEIVQFRKLLKPQQWLQLIASRPRRVIVNGRVLDRVSRPSKKPSFFDDFLALQYGWRPAMSDLYGAAEALSEKDRFYDRYRFDVVGTAKTQAASNQLLHDPFHQIVARQVRYTETKKAKVHLTFTLKNGAIAQFQSLGLINPYLLLWELTPWSFAFDWALPFGNWLNLLDADFGWSFKGGTRTEILRSNLAEPSGGLLVIGNDPQNIRIISHTPGAAKTFELYRSTYHSSPIPAVSSLVKNPLSSEHVANALALLSSALFRR